MIVKDAESTLAQCLESVRGVMDEMVIGDTGSIDSSCEVARCYGARVIPVPWENEFARARNRALEAVQSEWVLVLDADEVLDADARNAIPALLERSSVDGYLVPIWNYVPTRHEHLWDRPAKPNPGKLEAAAKYPAYTDHENVRLFRRLPEIRFVGRVHETVGSTILETGRKLGRASFIIHHFGFVVEAETRARKNHIYRELGREKIRDMPDNAQAHLELGLVEFDNFNNDAEAAKLFARACELNPRLTVAWLFAGLVRVRLGQYREALACLKHAEGDLTKAGLVGETQGDAYYNLGDFKSAQRCYRRAVECPEGLNSVRSKLGLTQVRLGHTREGLALMRQAIEADSTVGPLHDRLIVAQVWLNNLGEAAGAAERKLEAVDPQPEFFLRAASLRSKLRHWPRAAELLRAGLDRFPEAEKLRQALVEVEAGAASETRTRAVES